MLPIIVSVNGQVVSGVPFTDGEIACRMIIDAFGPEFQTGLVKFLICIHTEIPS